MADEVTDGPRRGGEGSPAVGELGRRSPLNHPFFLCLFALILGTQVLIETLGDDGFSFAVWGGKRDGRTTFVCARRPTPPSGALAQLAVPRPPDWGFIREGGEGALRETGELRAARRQGEAFTLLFDDHIESRNVGDTQPIRTWSLPVKGLRAIDLTQRPDGSFEVLGRTSEPGRELVLVEQSLGDWIPRRIAGFEGQAEPMASLGEAGDGDPRIYWVDPAAPDRLHSARFEGRDLLEAEAIILEEGSRFLGIVGLDPASGAAAALVLKGGSQDLVVFSTDGRRRSVPVAAAESVLGRLDGGADGSPELLVVRREEIERFELVSGEEGVDPVRKGAVPVPGLAAQGGHHLLHFVYLPALLALLVGVIVAFRRPLLSDPPLAFRPAALTLRLAACFIDLFLLGTVSWGLAGLLGQVGQEQTLLEILGRLDGEAGANPFQYMDEWLSRTLAFQMAIFNLLAALLEWGFGATLGKRLLGLVVVSEGERPRCRLWQALVRRFIWPVDISLVTVVFVFLGRRNQRLGDLAARTVVVRREAIAPPVKAAKGAGLGT